MPTSHEEHKIRIKQISDKMLHPITYNDAGAPRSDGGKPVMKDYMDRDREPTQAEMREDMRKARRDMRFRNMITGGR